MPRSLAPGILPDAAKRDTCDAETRNCFASSDAVKTVFTGLASITANYVRVRTRHGFSVKLMAGQKRELLEESALV